MSPKKIIFFAILWTLGIAILVGAIYLGNAWKKKPINAWELKIWISEGKTEDYADIIEGFKAYAPEYKNTVITVEKKTTDPLRYRTLLLSTMSDGNGPDIFMVGAGSDDVLMSKIESIPESEMQITDFDKRFDDIFLDLTYLTGAKDALTRYYLWIPMGYETLWVFYNKWLIKTPPQTWNDVDTLYEGMSEVYPTNLGLSSTFVPNMSDIVSLFLVQEGAKGYQDLGSYEKVFKKYLSYALRENIIQSEDIYTPRVSLIQEEESMQAEKLTTLDLFMQGKIAMIYGFPSMIEELEKAQKRTQALQKNAVVLTDRIPQSSLWKESVNIARYSFFALSKGSKNPYAGAKFLEYLATEDAMRLYLKHNSYMISAQHEFHVSQRDTPLSNTLSRATLGAFIPDPSESLIVFSYGLKTDFMRFLDESIDRNKNIDISNIGSSISGQIRCSLATYQNSSEIPTECEKNQ